MQTAPEDNASSCPQPFVLPPQMFALGEALIYGTLDGIPLRNAPSQLPATSHCFQLSSGQNRLPFPKAATASSNLFFIIPFHPLMGWGIHHLQRAPCLLSHRAWRVGELLKDEQFTERQLTRETHWGKCLTRTLPRKEKKTNHTTCF